ncbi:hypothetical protein DENSPDRAFT_428631 [Dentipellis sp. KUC8613]|nr:hypothetical protein DENSPDRAFT_428631 [Dentipellis sp. KUC8613]
MADSQRQYIDLIFRASNKYGSWDPEVAVEAGDYGRVTQGHVRWWAWWRKKGIFLKEGNIFKSKLAEEFDIPQSVEHGPDAVEGVTWVTSDNAEETDFSAEASGKVPGFASCKVKGAFKFTSGAGAVLTMQDETITTIDPPGSLRRLLNDERMRGFVIVSEVHRCSSYVRYLSSPTTKSIAIGLSADAPTPGAPGGNVDAKWVRSTATGNFKAKVGKEGTRNYYPLFRLVSVKETQTSTGLRGNDELPPLEDALPPWSVTESEVPASGGDDGEAAKTSRRSTLHLPFMSRK